LASLTFTFKLPYGLRLVWWINTWNMFYMKIKQTLDVLTSEFNPFNWFLQIGYADYESITIGYLLPRSSCGFVSVIIYVGLMCYLKSIFMTKWSKRWQVEDMFRGTRLLMLREWYLFVVAMHLMHPKQPWIFRNGYYECINKMFWI